MKPLETLRTPFPLLLLAAVGCDASTSPAGSEPPVSELGINQGTLTLADFEPAPVPFDPTNPYGEGDLMLSECVEVAFFTPGADHEYPLTGAQWIREDLLSGGAIVPGTHETCCVVRKIRDAVAGNVDADPEDELVAVQLVPQAGGTNAVRVIVGNRNASGGVSWTTVQEYASGSVTNRDASIAVGDFDGDFRDEIVVTSSSKYEGLPGNVSWLRVLDDVEEGCGEMLYFYRPEGHCSMRGYAADLDGDQIDELILGLEGDTTSSGRYAVRVYRGGEDVDQLTEVHGWRYLNAGVNGFGGKLAVGDFDGDRTDEVAFVGALGGVGGLSSAWVRLHEWNGAAGFTLTSSHSQPLFTGTHHARGKSFDVCAVDRFGGGRDELALMSDVEGGDYEIDLIAWDADDLQWSVSTVPIDRPAPLGAAVRVRAGDGDGDGAEDLFFGITEGYWATWKRAVYGVARVGPTPTATVLGDDWFWLDGVTNPPVVAPAELDGDGLRVRFTGRRTLNVSDPIPLVLLAAPPTKSSISQNYSASRTSYFEAAGSSEAIGVSSSATISFLVGFEAQDVTGAFGASVKGKTENRFTSTETTTTRTTFLSGFSGDADHDVIVFQANLYESYEYEILSSPRPSLIGAYYTLDIPIDSNTYKWTVNFYNASVRDPYVIGPDLLPHTIGDPSSYPTLAETQAHVDRYVGWRVPQDAAVGQGSGTRGLGIDLVTESATSEQRESTASLEMEFKAGFGVVGGSYAATNGEVYETVVSEQTVYESEVGDILDWVDYQNYGYDFGLAVYKYGRLADSQNVPTGEVEPGTYPMTIVTYWVDPTGSEY
ncbi:MAG: hypothetical protein AAGA20_23750 [Planctomycetota bacterium]